MRIYIASAYSAATPEEVHRNVNRSLDAATALLLAGHIPFAPLLFHFWHLRNIDHGVKVTYEQWLAWAMTWVLQCEGFLYLASSPRADKELALAEKHGLIIFRTLEEALLTPTEAAKQALDASSLTCLPTGPRSAYYEKTQSLVHDPSKFRGDWCDCDSCNGKNIRRFTSEPE